MGSGRVTVRDIAREAGVSIATVSRAMSNDSAIADATRSRVLEKAAEMGYSPNLFARGLITKRSGIAAVFANNITNPFYPEVVVKLTRKLQRLTLHTMLFASDDGEEMEQVLPTLREVNPDIVIILAATVTSRALHAFQNSRTPVILFNRYVEGVAESSVCCDNFEGGRMVAQRLAGSGHTRLAFIEGMALASTSVDRRDGFLAGAKECGLEPPLVRKGGDFTHETGYRGMQELFDPTAPIDAVFCANDIIAIGAMGAARGPLGLRVPEDLSVVGFDDIAMAGWPSHDLTTVRQPMGQMIEQVGVEVARVLSEDATEPQQHFLPGRLVLRGSARLSAEGE